MKKFLNVKSVSAIILCFILAFALCACQNAEPSSSSDDVTSMLLSPSSSIDDETSSDTTVDNSSQDEVSSETTIDTPPKDTKPPVTSSDTNTSSSNTPSDTTDKTPTPSKPTTTESTPTTTTPPKTAAELIVGKWRGSIDMAPMFSEEMGFEFKGPATVWCDMEFTSGGAIYEIINRVSLEGAYFNVYTEWLNNTITTQGLTIEQFEIGAGMSFDEYVNTLVEASMKLVPLTATHSYKFEGSDLYILQQGEADFEKTEYSFDGDDKLILNQDGVNVTYTRIK